MDNNTKAPIEVITAHQAAGIIRKIDSVNAKYIMQNEEIMDKFARINKYIQKGKNKVADTLYCNVLERIREYNERRLTPANVKVGDGVTVNLYTDKYAATIVKVTAKTITVQRDTATLDQGFVPNIIPGGFAGHCTNQDEQTYSYESNPDGEIWKCQWSEKHQHYFAKGKFLISKGRHEFYDYNY